MHTIYIYDDIGPEWMGLVSAQYVISEIEKAKKEPITVRINSPGGDVFEGQAIYNALLRRGNVTVEIDALAASAASFIAMAGDTIRIAENAMVMIHNASTITIGNKAEHAKNMELLDKVDGIIADVYTARSGKDRSDITSKMADETWFTAKEAIEYGLATEIGTPLKVSANLKAGRYTKAPAAILSMETEREKQRKRLQDYVAAKIRLTNLQKPA